MADRHLVGAGNPADEVAQVLQREVVPGVEPESLPAGLLGGGQVGGDRRCGIRGVLPGVGLGVELHAVGAAGLRSGDHFGHGIDEDRDADAPFAEAGGDAGEKFAVRHGVPPGVGGDGVGCVGHERDLCGPHLQHQRDEVRNRIALNVEFGGQHPCEVPHVVVADVARVGPRVDRDAVRAEAFDVRGRADHVGEIAAARVAHHGDLIDVYAQLCHKKRYICGEIRAAVRRPGPESRSAGVSAW